MTDFISQATLDSLELSKDVLWHEQMANSILDKAPYLPPGAVIAVQGPWGRGKTDVLARIAKKSLTDQRPDWMACETIWINPWQYGTPDLLTPLVLGLLERVPVKRRASSKSLRMAAETIIRAGANFGLKAASLVVPGGGILKEAAGPVDDLLKGLFSALKENEIAPPEPDPVSKMADRFRELVKEVLESRNAGHHERLVICIDDLDRCLPDRQVALLEAMRFLTSTGAAATFLVALDPTLARQAVVAHYGTTAFDPDRYLDKMFHLRVNLPALNKTQLFSLVNGRLEQIVPCVCNIQPLKVCLSNLVEKYYYSGFPENTWVKDTSAPSIDDLADAFSDALAVRDLRNPRIIDRIFQRLYLIAISGLTADDIGIKAREDLRNFIMWLGIIERWPDIRAAFQNADIDQDEAWGSLRGRRLAEICLHYFPLSEEQLEHINKSQYGYLWQLYKTPSAIIDRLPSREESPELRQMIGLLASPLVSDIEYLAQSSGDMPSSNWQELAFQLEVFDDALVSVGL